MIYFFKFLAAELYFSKTNYKDTSECLVSQRTSHSSAPSHAMLLGLQKAIKGATCFCIPSVCTVG